jgi:hypothetical protein
MMPKTENNSFEKLVLAGNKKIKIKKNNGVGN